MGLYDILLDHQREFRALLDRPYVPRRVSIPSGIEDLVRVVIGPRRAGKSVFSAQVGEPTSRGGISAFRCCRFRFFVIFSGRVWSGPSVSIVVEVLL